MKKILFAFLIIAGSIPVMAQTYNPKVSKDSLSILNNRVEVLKMNMKVLELKIREAEEEADVVKLRLKLLEANGNAKASSENHSGNINKSGTVVDQKAAEKLSKKAKSDADDAQKALERYNKQITKVEDIRTQIQGEDRKLGYKKPILVYDYK
ncbi:hypothetical protein EZ449_16655 [Pedobacter frigidisoli]|uniref:Uncharacterized protein n=1 Tax=Pedobacter frigidisoli TaxID=2530455 RepID=A0A4R0NZI1_9SPHI|nr:hypothetical protein [Pedobacter frigidisoli]TCD04581.1 hypothetical protein EZ449_16655 [Pedobacter frigidisoli]